MNEGTRYLRELAVQEAKLNLETSICRCGHSELDHVCNSPHAEVVPFRPCYRCRCLGYEFEHAEEP